MTKTGLTDVIPIMPYEDIRAAHDFLVEVLGFDAGGVVEDPDGVVVHGEVTAGGRRIWLHAVAGGLTTPSLSGASTAGITVMVDDVDAHFAHAKAHGATIVREPEDQEYGLRDYSVQDPEGHNWYPGTPITP